MTMSSIRLKELQGKFDQEFPINPQLDKKIKEIEQSMQNMLSQPKATSQKAPDGSNMLVCGGLQSYSHEAAQQYLHKMLDPAITGHFEVFKMSNEFKGVMFVKCLNHQEASIALGVLRQSVAKENVGKDFANRLWCDFKKPIETRVCDGFMGGLKTQLAEWKFPKTCMTYNSDSGVFKVEGKEVLKVSVIQNEFQYVWVDKLWGEWEQLQASPEFQELIKRAKDRLAQSQAFRSKGAGKGQ
jgi:hypothetical protein